MMEEERTVDPLEVVKDPEVVRGAQVELKKLDVLVCGECHEVFHFIKEFQEHRQKCTKESILKDSIQDVSKSQVWAFMLWKNAKFKNACEEETPPSSWNVYQLWCNLDQTQKDSWVAAGKSLQAIHMLNMSVHQSTSKGIARQSLNKLVKKEDEESSDVDIKPRRKKRRVCGDSMIKSEHDPLADTESDTEEKKGDKFENGGLKKTLLTPILLNSDVTILPTSKKITSRKALRTTQGNKKSECTVEKILTKRYNPGKKTHEYLIKWENMDEEDNTWEPVANLDNCRQLVDDFDRTLQRLKAQKIARGNLVQRRTYRKAIPEKNIDIILNSAGRPQRTSKQKALNQVKVWCGNMSDADEDSGKRAYSDSDSDSFEKKLKFEEDSSDSEYEQPLKRIVRTSVNGIGKKEPIPENVLIPDEQGVVKIPPEQLSKLSSGVYVMSKTAGIIKLDSNASKIAASGGHAVIKIAPKIGQTSIKVIKKEPTNGSKSTVFTTSKLKPGIRPISARVIAHRKVPPNIISPKKLDPPKSEVINDDDDESDGLEELPFPTDLPLPVPDSPPRDFTLCPLTGKILGENDNVADILLEKSNLQDDAQQDCSAADNLDNLVKLAAADILGESPEDVKPKIELKAIKVEPPFVEDVDSEPQLEPTHLQQLEVPEQKVEVADKTQSIEDALSAMEADDVPHAPPEPIITSTPMRKSSILSTALTNANIESTITVVPKKVADNPEVIRQKTAMNRNIINRTIVPKPSPQAIITRITPGHVNRNKQFMNRPKLGTGIPTIVRKTVPKTYFNKNPNIIRRTYHPSPSTSIVEKSETTNVTTESLVETLSSTNATTSTPVINMPLLTDVDTSPTHVVSEDREPQQDIEQPQIDQSSLSETNETLPSQTLNTISLNETEAPLLITGEDGTIYQVAGQNEDGQTILITQGTDGQQQCLLVASENTTDLTESMSNNTTPVEAPTVRDEPGHVESIETPVTEAEGESVDDSQILAQIVSAQAPSPGGSRKVVLMLPDGNLMMTEVTAEQYAALELDK